MATKRAKKKTKAPKKPKMFEIRLTKAASLTAPKGAGGKKYIKNKKYYAVEGSAEYEYCNGDSKFLVSPLVVRDAPAPQNTRKRKSRAQKRAEEQASQQARALAKAEAQAALDEESEAEEDEEDDDLDEESEVEEDDDDLDDEEDDEEDDDDFEDDEDDDEDDDEPDVKPSTELKKMLKKEVVAYAKTLGLAVDKDESKPAILKRIEALR